MFCFVFLLRFVGPGYGSRAQVGGPTPTSIRQHLHHGRRHHHHHHHHCRHILFGSVAYSKTQSPSSKLQLYPAFSNHLATFPLYVFLWPLCMFVSVQISPLQKESDAYRTGLTPVTSVILTTHKDPILKLVLILRFWAGLQHLTGSQAALSAAILLCVKVWGCRQLL